MNAPDTHILTRLHDERARAMTIGRTPSRIYLGEEQYDALEKIGEEFIGGLKGDYGAILTWNGMGVFRVKQKSHVGFGFSPDSPCG